MLKKAHQEPQSYLNLVAALTLGSLSLFLILLHVKAFERKNVKASKTIKHLEMGTHSSNIATHYGQTLASTLETCFMLSILHIYIDIVAFFCDEKFEDYE